MATLSRSASAGPQLPNYVITEKIGAGSYATVFKAYRKTGPREVVAVKCVTKSSLNNTSKENLLTEIELLKTLHHENIVLLKDFMWDDSYIYLILEFCSGGDLASLIRSRRVLHETVVRRFLQQLASALQYMRSMHVSHMDLKPSNILLSSTQHPQLKIGDFGFAHYVLGDTEAEFVRGSLLYMAPEIIVYRQYNEKADLWSVGVILYECLFGRAPFASRTMQELREKILDTDPIEIPSGVDISDSCRDLVLRLLQRNPEQRISYDEFLNHPFLDFDHRPCPEALQKATGLVTRAVSRDVDGCHAEAVTLYCKSFEFFIPAIHYEKDLARKQALREKVKEYMARAEELQQMLKPTQTQAASLKQQQQQQQSSLREKSLQPADELERLSADKLEMMSAIQLIRSAEAAETVEDYETAFDRYEQSLDVLIKCLQEEPRGTRRDLLQSQVSRWMSRAEDVKRYVMVREQLRKQHANVTRSEADTSSASASYCLVQ